MRIASIDYGLKRIGLAISDEQKIIASPLDKIECHKTPAETIKRIIQALKPYVFDKIIIGYPLHMSGKISFLADEVKDFAELLQKEVNCPVILWDERLSSIQAERALRESGMSRKKRTKFIDSLSAVILLESYLEFISGQLHQF